MKGNPKWPLCLSVAMAIIFVGQFLFFFNASLIDVPWGDGLLAIREFEELGLVGFLTKPVNEHFVLIPRLINLLDLYLGHYALPISGHLTLVAYLSFVFFRRAWSWHPSRCRWQQFLWLGLPSPPFPHIALLF